MEDRGGAPARIVIVGGGTAGWMAASALARFVRNGRSQIRLVESDEIGTVGVGEATIPPIRNFLQMLRIDEADFIRNTHGTFKLGIEFQDWYRPGHRYLHPFGQFGADIEGVPFHQFFLKRFGPADKPGIEAWSMTATAARQGRFGSVQGQGFPLSQWAWAYHFDASEVARYLRGYSEKLGVLRSEGRVTAVLRHAESGLVEALELADGSRVEGDFFIDCSGFRSLLLGEALGVPFTDWSHWLPCDRALAAPSRRNGPPRPYTVARARPAGWQWDIPLQHRNGNGHVYASAFMDDDQANQLLLDNIDGEVLAEPRLLQFRTGRRAQFWSGNCLALGLAAGFMEPLESTAIHLVQTGIAKLLALLPGQRMDPLEIDEYNRLVGASYEQIRDFLILHYKATQRDDSEFWRHCASMDIPESLQRRIDLFAGTGRLIRAEDELFSVSSWTAVLLGQGIWPARRDPLVDSLAEAELDSLLQRMYNGINQAAGQLPLHQEFIDRHCRSQS